MHLTIVSEKTNTTKNAVFQPLSTLGIKSLILTSGNTTVLRKTFSSKVKPDADYENGRKKNKMQKRSKMILW